MNVGSTDPRPARAGCTIAGLLVTLVVTGAVVAVGVVAVRTHLFGMFSIVREPYYREIVHRVTTDPTFIAQLGAPLSIDDTGVWCNAIDDDASTSKANCFLPLRGPRGSGNVHAQIFVRPGAMDTAFFLHIGDRSITGAN